MFCRFPDNFEKLSPPILQLDEVEFYYSPDQPIFSGLNLSADLESRICIVRVVARPKIWPLTVMSDLGWSHLLSILVYCVRLEKMALVNLLSWNCWWASWRQSRESDKLTGETADSQSEQRRNLSGLNKVDCLSYNWGCDFQTYALFTFSLFLIVLFSGTSRSVTSVSIMWTSWTWTSALWSCCSTGFQVNCNSIWP